MGLAQLIVICFASAGVAWAFISLGLMSYRQRWLNYVIALAAGIVGAWLGLTHPAFKSIALVVSVFTSVLSLAVYHGLRWYFVSSKTEQEAQMELDAEQNFFAIGSKN